MTKEEKLKIAKKITQINMVYGFKISDEVALYQAELISDLPFVLVVSVLDELVKENTTGRPPTIGQVRAKLNPQTDDRSIAIELARKFYRAIAKHGSVWELGFWENGSQYFEDDKGNRFPNFKSAVISELGEIGWQVIESRGGWERVTISANEEKEGIYQAQLRDQIEATIKNKKAGIDVSKIPLPNPAQDAIKALISNMELKKV